MDIQNLLGGFEVGWLTFVLGVASAFIMRMKLSKPILQKSTVTEKQK